MGLPAWVQPRDYQYEAVERIVDGFRRHDVMVLDAPTGSGKTVIAEMVRQRMMEGRGRYSTGYVCSSLTLQDQFASDFTYAKVAKGRSNYIVGDGTYTADSCSGRGCQLCPDMDRCPYVVAREEAMAAPLSCVNSTYLLHQRDPKWNRDLLIIDECDVMLDELLSYAEVNIPQYMIREAAMKLPIKGAHKRTLVKWLRNWQAQARTRLHGLREQDKRKWMGKIATVDRLLELGEDNWLRQTHPTALVLKPLDVRATAQSDLWGRASKFLLMSSTVISDGLLLDEMGYQGGHGLVRVPMQFPVENRLIHAGEGVTMTYKDRETCWPEMGEHLLRVVQEGEGPFLVHAVSYKLAEYLAGYLLDRGVDDAWVYSNSSERAKVLKRFKRMGGVLIAPSMDRGVDFPDDEVRTVVVCKIPYPNLKDRVVQAKMHGPGGQQWYAVQTVRSLVQMTGRATRGMNDWSRVHILDRSFKRLYSQNRRLFPEWWRDAVRW